jgi:hypothetical protein
MGASDEIESMFVFFVKKYMYVDSSSYPLVDKTNRHGIAHGAYVDADYGRPLNFFKKGASFQAVEELRTHIDAFIKDYNETARPFAWTKPKVHQKYLKPCFGHLEK